VAARKGGQEILQKIWELTEEYLTTEEIRHMLLAKNKSGRTVLQEAAMLGNVELLQKLQEWAREKLTTGEVNNKLLLFTGSEDMTAWHVAAAWGKPEVLQKIWDWIE